MLLKCPLLELLELLVTSTCLLMSATFVSCKTRTYFIAAVDIDWDYAPLGNLVNFTQADYDIFLKPSVDPPRIGKVYKKAVFREFEDASFSRAKERPPWLGVLGPILRAEINDTVEVHFWNNASRTNLTLHPHGVLYYKNAEGALYEDGTWGSDKADDGVPSGGRYKYIWHVDPRYGPTADDPPCLTWAYHSHHYAERDINTGLVGAMVLCKPGILDETTGQRSDVDREYVLFYHVMDENKSWYIEENLKRVPNSEDSKDVLEDEDFQESNMMHAVNGFLYGNLLGVEGCVGDTISWHLFSLGNEVDVHNVRFQGQTMVKRKSRSNFVTLFPAKFETLRSKVHFEGTWTMFCDVYDHNKAGMQAFFNVNVCGKTDDFGGLTNVRPVRSYHVAAQDVVWDYGPSGLNRMTGRPLEDDPLSSPHFSKNDGHLGGRYWKALYRQYTDDSFSTLSPRDPHLGILGPVISGEIGDIINITFYNNASRPFSLMLNGATVRLIASDIKYFGLGDSTTDVSRAAKTIVAPGDKLTTYWLITKDDLNASMSDGNCISSFYASFADIRDHYTGMLGILLVCKPGTLRVNGLQKGFDKEYFLLLANMDENESLYLDRNIAEFSANKTVNKDDESFRKSNLMYSINGLMFGNVDGLTACLGDRIAWHAHSLGSESDVHVLHFDGLGITYENSHRDGVDLFPGVSRTFTMDVDSAGTKEINCMTNAHHVGGMRAKMDIETCPGKNNVLPPAYNGQERVYYIGAVEEEWDYAPNETHPIFNKNLNDVDQSRTFVHRDATHIGKKYKKAVFREYTDPAFVHLKPRPPHLGLLGPLVKAEVGDVVKVHFKNMASRSYNIEAHGVPRNDSVRGGVGPNETAEYEWTMLARSGPGQDDLNCITWAYYSTLDPEKDVNTGLVGPLVICRQGTLDATGSRKDVRGEYALMFSIMDENKSWYLDDNIQTYCSKPDKVDKENPEFQESNLKHGINGYLYDNLKGMTLREDEPVAFYLIGLGDEVDIHTVHFHGETFVSNSGGLHRGDVKELFPGTFETVQLTPANPGLWLLHCHVNDHMEAGMMTTYAVLPKLVKPVNGTAAGRHA